MSILSRLSTYLIHYSPLVKRLTYQSNSPIWSLLSLPLFQKFHIPQTLSNSYCFPSHSILPLRAQIWSQTSQITHILNLHCEALRSNDLYIPPALHVSLSAHS